MYKENTIEKRIKADIFSFPKKSNLGNTKNYKVITFTVIAAKICNTLHLNHIQPQVEKILRKKSRISEKVIHKFLAIHWIIEGVCAKNLKTCLFVDFSKAFDSIHREKIEQILLAYSLSKET